MSFQATAARSSRITKSRKPSAAAAMGLRRSVSSPSKASPRRKSSTPAKTPSLHDNDDEKLDDAGVIASLAADLHFRDIPQYMEYIRGRMFSPIPQTGAGMNSTRIAEVLNFRLSLPPIVTVAHIDALSPSSTRTEREILELAQAGILRRVTIPNRGVGAAAVGDGIASVLEWQKTVQSNPELTQDLKEKYISVMNANPTSGTVPGTTFTPPEISALTTTGFLTSANQPDSRSSLFASPGAGSLASLSSVGSRHASGSLAAVGGVEATKYISGGSGQRIASSAHYNFSLPNTGSHTKLVVDARSHLLSLLRKSKHKEAPMELLHDRWDGGAPASDAQTQARKARGEFAGVLPGRTKKWKQFRGMRFEWIVEECMGAGLVECFETGSVGVGVRIV